MAASVSPELEQLGSPIEPAANQTLFLSDPEKVWLVASGKLDLFLVDTEQGEPIGARFHVLRVEEGQAVFGLGSDGSAETEIVASAPPGAKLICIDLARLRESASSNGHAVPLVEQWVNALAAAAADRGQPRRFRPLEPGAEISVGDKQVPVVPRRGVVWARHVEGRSLYLANEKIGPIEGSGYFPVSRLGWLLAAPESRLECIESVALTEADPQWRGLRSFHRVVLTSFILKRGNEENKSRERLKAKAASDAALINSSLASLSSPLRREREEEGLDSGSSDDPLLAACQAIGRRLGLEVRQHPEARRGAKLRDPVAAIAQASGMRVRRVVLKGKWWHEDNGPILAFTEKENQPVALLPQTNTSYRLFDPARQTSVRVGARAAETLTGAASIFYRPFPNKPLNAFDIVRFGLHGCRNDVITIMAMGVAGGMLGMLSPILTGIIFDTIIPGAQRTQMLQISAVLVVSALSGALFTLTRNFAVLRLEGRMDSFVQAAVWDRLLGLPAPFFRDYSSGDLATRAMGINSIRRTLTGTTLSSILSAIFSVFSFALLFYYSVNLALLAAFLVSLAFAVTTIRGFLLLKYQRELSRLGGKISGMVLEFIHGVAKFRIAGTEGRAFSVWAREFAKQKKLSMEARQISNSVAVFNSAFPVISSAAVFFVTAGLINQPGIAALTTGTFLAFSAAFGQFMGATLDLGSRIVGILNIVPLYERAKPILETLPEVDAGKSDPGELQGTIEVNHVTFRYREDTPLVLRDVSLSIKPGQFVAIVGPSGCGKSTLFRLLLGFEKPESGAIYYDGQDLAGLDIRAARRQIGTVLQNGRVVDGDILTNIIGSKALGIEDAWEAARMSGLDKDIEAMPMGMHTFISQEGGGLSGGQRQRLMIARAIVSKPRILFFDEATSALDNRTQAIVSESLESLKATRVVIAHRLSTIVNTDRIFVLEKGVVTQAGTHEELIEKEGPFADLAKRQMT